MKSIEDHIAKDKEILADPKTSEPMKRHAKEESVSYTHLTLPTNREV